MTLESFQHTIKEQREIELQQNHLEDVLRLYILLSEVNKLSFYEYDHRLNSFAYCYTITKEEKTFLKDPPDPFSGFKYTLIAEESDVTYGMIAFDETPVTNHILAELFENITKILKKIFYLQKEVLAQDQKLDIYIISDDETMQFAKNLEKNLDILLNADIRLTNSIYPVLSQLKQKFRKSIVIYTVANDALLKKEEKYLNTNDFLVVIGPDDFDLLLFCGRLNVYQYLSINDFVSEKIRRIISETKFELQNKYLNKNNIIGMAGISGGAGVTTIAMNAADLLAKNSPDENVLFIDLSKTKAISNLFLTQNPIPKKTIIDLINSNKYDIGDNLENGLEKIRENFYAVNGIQKHIDSDYLEQSVFIEKLLEYISKMSEKFNYVLIDIGKANANKLNTTMYDIVNELWIISDMSLPQVSKMKTFFSLMKRAGLKDKLTFVMNRYDDANNSISISDVESILNATVDDKVNFDYRISLDYKTMSHCWNYCELATKFDSSSPFVKQLEAILVGKSFYEAKRLHGGKKSLFSFKKLGS